MANPNLDSEATRNSVIEEIKSEENRTRKREHQKRFDIYRDKQDQYILERLEREFDSSTVQEMRKIFSINLSKRIIDESIVYKRAPERSFMAGDGEASEEQVDQMEVLYKKNRVDNALKVSNAFYKNHDQSFIMVVPDNRGGLKVRALAPQQLDVIPDEVNPEIPYAYVINFWDKDLHKSVKNVGSERTQFHQYRFSDNLNQRIADPSDRDELSERLIWWTAEKHFVTDGKGRLIGEEMDNPIKELPFVDVSLPDAKDFQFFVEYGSNIAEFAVDFGLLLTDTANTVRLQNYSQAIIYSDKQPQDMTVGPNKVMWIEINPDNPSFRPSFEFVSPSPDLNGTMEFLENFVRFFLSSKGIDPGTISGKGQSKSFSSGMERLLAMLDKFEATREDFDLFEYVEQDVMKLIMKWHNALFQTEGDSSLRPEMQKTRLPDDLWMEVKFHEPQAVQTQKEREDSAIMQLQEGLMSRSEAISNIRGIPEEKAEEVLAKISEEEIGMKEDEPDEFNIDKSDEEEDEEDDEEQDDADESIKKRLQNRR